VISSSKFKDMDSDSN